MTRRGALGLLGGLAVGAAGWVAAARARAGPSPRPRVVAGTVRLVESYGPAAGEWWVPPGADRGARLPTVVLVHGGYWRPRYDRHLQDAVAADLAGRGVLCWVPDYASSASAWPSTLRDVAAAYDWIGRGRYAGLVDPARVSVVGHSAGGHLALWLVSRARLPAGAPGAVGAAGHPSRPAPAPSLAVAQAPVAALVAADRERLGGGAVAALLGGTPREQPARYRIADPMALLPSGTRTVLVHGTGDDVVPLSQSEAYVAAAVAAGDRSALVRVEGGHFVHLDPASQACARMREALGVG